jgi:rsbT co-antagonist protein RsbR
MSNDAASTPDAPDFETRTYDRITDILMVLSEVTAGDFTSRLPDLQDDEAFGTLYRGINEMVESLSTAQDNALRYQRDLEEKLTTIERQRAAIRELSTPVIEVWEGVLCLPIVGVMDTVRSADMTESLMRAVVDKRALCTIVDITGIEVMDTRTADHFIRMAKAVRLLGAQCVLTGVSPGIAQTIIHMGIDMSGIVCHRTLRDALQAYVRTTESAQRREAAAGANGRARSDSRGGGVNQP